jgi:hypothetical protein
MRIACGTAAGVAALAVSCLAQTDTSWKSAFNGKDFTGWHDHTSNWTVRYANTDSAEIYGSGNTTFNTFLIYKEPLLDFEFESAVRMPFNGSNSGIQVRSSCLTAGDTPPCGAQRAVCGPQADLGNTHHGEFYGECTGPIVNVNSTNGPGVTTTISACRQTMKNPPAWNMVRMRVVGNKVIGWLNEAKCYEYTITNSDWLRNSIFALQFHKPSYSVEFKSLRIKNLATTTAARGGKAPTSARHDLRTGRGTLQFSIAEAGPFSVRVTDVGGKVIASVRGVGPLSGQALALPSSGLYLVGTRSLQGESMRKIYVH